ncbi:DUF58 domain-containing protein [Colwelliaceae bacterium 6471]
MPSAERHQLSNRNIFILPTRFGLMYLLFVLLLFLLGTNYQNNVIILLSYLLVSVFITCMMHSFFNLSGLIFSGQSSYHGFAGQAIAITLTVTSDKARYHLNFAFDKQSAVHIGAIAGVQSVDIPYLSSKRGVFKPGRVKISSEYSFGLFKSWTQLDFDHQCIVYPKPKAFKNQQTPLGNASNSDGQGGSVQPGFDDFYELKAYVPGEPLSRVAWKQYARGQGQLTKHYQQYSDNTVWLRLNDMPATTVEEKLQYLCFLALEYHQSGQCFGVDLHSEKIQPSIGQEHIHTCLSALAFYPNRTA